MKSFLTALMMWASVVTGGAYDATVDAPRAYNNVYICLTKKSECYHSHRCRGLANCKGKIMVCSLEYAIEQGYRPCKNCYN